MPKLIAIAFCLAAILPGKPALCEEADTPEPPAAIAPAQEQNTQPAKADDTADEAELPPGKEQELSSAIEVFAAGNVGKAYLMFELLARQTHEKEVAAEAAKYLEVITATGQQQIKDVLALEDPTQALGKLKDLYRPYWTTPLKQKLILARKQIQIRMAQKTAALRAEEAEKDEDEDEAEDKGEEEDAAEKEKVAQMWLIIGDIHRINGRKQKAREAYDVLIYEYPHSRFTDQARDRIELLRIDNTIEAPEEKGGEK
ncbi:MAG: hypothetical protein HQ592_00900 [Planctomycetes bacterium]|nr:hypothetical protein [Planctomycetota bacterium]